MLAKANVQSRLAVKSGNLPEGSKSHLSKRPKMLFRVAAVMATLRNALEMVPVAELLQKKTDAEYREFILNSAKVPFSLIFFF